MDIIGASPSGPHLVHCMAGSTMFICCQMFSRPIFAVYPLQFGTPKMADVTQLYGDLNIRRR